MSDKCCLLPCRDWDGNRTYNFIENHKALNSVVHIHNCLIYIVLCDMDGAF
jgi:hypothetical protein